MDLEEALLGVDKKPSTLKKEEKKRKDQKAKLHMKQRLYAHYLEEGASVHEHLTVFKEILSNLKAMEVQYDKEDLGLILLCSLPPSYSIFRDTILYSRESLTVDEDIGTDPRGKSKGRSKSSNREDYSDGELLVTSVNNSKVSEEWILDSGYTFHMSPNRDWFTTYETVSEGVVLMGNNASCKIAGVGIIKVKMFDGVVRTFSDGSTVTGDATVASSSLSNDDITKLWHMRLGSSYSTAKCVTERMNRTIMEKARCMLSNANLPKSFWAESAFTACFLINRSPSIVIEKNTPQEVWPGNPIDYSDIKIFRCPTYAHVDNGKLELRSTKCVFRGYKIGVKGREIKPPKKYVEVDLVAYALNVAEDIDANQELSNYSVVVIKKKEETLGVEESRYKAMLVAKGYSQIPGVDFTDVFFPIVKHSLIQALLGIVAMHDLELEQLDKNSDGSFVYLLLYVDDILIAAKDKGEIRKVKAQLNEEFKMRDFGPAKKILGMEILRDKKIGRTRDGIIGYVNVDFARDLDRRRSLTSYVFTIGGCTISWKATLQTTVALSTTAAEYMAITEACK
ncbi:hypothetical protein CXB51_035009 [Gossypium anomalum]|uniref:Reverse transcriptase Ty1/copia-type domain-containing protein n=1 Tax=Gossypium anomalum TaxID=47600 RepID=A0A8J5XQG1_9ROSI|nr:hypothetical protein CXB51_035009 [Gossypium anomalum]